MIFHFNQSISVSISQQLKLLGDDGRNMNAEFQVGLRTTPNTFSLSLP